MDPFAATVTSKQKYAVFSIGDIFLFVRTGNQIERTCIIEIGLMAMCQEP